MNITEFLESVEEELEFPVSKDELVERFGDVELEFDDLSEETVDTQTLKAYLNERESPAGPEGGATGPTDPPSEEFRSIETMQHYFVDLT